MKFFLSTCLIICAASSTCFAQNADAVYTNGRIYTVNEAQRWAEAVAIKDGKFIEVGSHDDVRSLIGDGTEVVDLEDNFAMPGIHDTHVHPTHVNSAKEQGQLMFPESSSKEEVITALMKYAAENPELKIIKGSKWAPSLFPEGKATREWIDEALVDRPVVLWDESFHNAVANSAALKLAGITKDTPDPEFGVIDRDPDTGEPTGYLSEQAISLVGKIIPRPTEVSQNRLIHSGHTARPRSSRCSPDRKPSKHSAASNARAG